MSSSSFVAEWPSDLFEKIVETVRADRLRYSFAFGTQRPPVPNEAQTKDLVEIALRASLEREEGRSATFSLVFCDRTEAEGMPFVASEELTPEAIRRLMPTADPDMDGIGVSATDTGLQIWGVAGRREDAFVVRATAPGRVMACFGGATVARFDGHTCSLLRVDRYQVLGVAADLLPGTDQAANLVKMQFLWGLGITLRSLTHGGTVAILGEGTAIGSVEGGRELAPLELLAEKVLPAIAELQQLTADFHDESPASLMGGVAGLHDLQTGGLPAGETGELLRKIGRLTQVDGALVLDHRFRVVNIGAKLYAATPVASWWMWEPENPEWRLEEGNDGKFEGTRHSSALRFVAANPGCVALVCSQDGAVTFVGCPGTSDAPRIMKNLDLILT